MNYELSQASNMNIFKNLDELSFTNEQVVNTTENNYELTLAKPRKIRELPIDWRGSSILTLKR